MKVHIKVFGPARDITGGETLEFDFQANTVAELKMSLFKAYPDLEKFRSLFIALNQKYTEGHEVIGPSDELAIIPPVSGG